MSKKGWESVLIKSVNTKVFHTLKTKDYTVLESCELALKVRPVHVITIKET